MMTNEQARALLGRGFLSYAFEILWRSVAFTVVLSGVDYLLQPKAFTRDSVIINFIAFVVLNTLIVLFGVLIAAGRYRRRPKNWDDDVSESPPPNKSLDRSHGKRVSHQARSG